MGKEKEHNPFIVERNMTRKGQHNNKTTVERILFWLEWKLFYPNNP
jgi:hypothetical protein